MYSWQTALISFFAIINIIFFIIAFRQCYKNKNAYGDTKFLYPLGSFVWADQVIFGVFWTAISVVCLLLQDWLLFLLIVSLFFLVRSTGETIYWFNQQFSTINKNPPKKYILYKVFQNDSVWFVHQIINQCQTVIAIVLSMYLAKLWLATV